MLVDFAAICRRSYSRDIMRLGVTRGADNEPSSGAVDSRGSLLMSPDTCIDTGCVHEDSLRQFSATSLLRGGLR